MSLPLITNLMKRKPEIVKALVDYLDTRGREAEPMTDRVVYRADSREITVWKMKREGSSLVARALPTGAYITRREDQLVALLEDAIRTKVHKLRDVIEPKILVILDDYGFQRSLAEWQERLPPETSHFMALVRVSRTMNEEKAELIAGVLPSS